MGKTLSIKRLIYNEYYKAALIPILIIELTLLVMYFATTSYIGHRTTETMLGQAALNIEEIASREVKNINQQLEGITSLCVIAQRENARFFENPARFSLPADKPIFATAPNGVVYKTNDNGGACLWYSRLTPFGATQEDKARRTEAFDPTYRRILEANSNIVAVYFNTFDSMNRYFPFIPKVYEVYDPNMNIPEFNFYYLADAAHNPSRGVVWTDAYLDPAGKGWMASAIAPVYRGDFLEGVVGIDVTIDRFVNNILNLKLPWGAAAFLVDSHGVILAMPEMVENTFGLKELRQQVYNDHVRQDTLKPEEFNLLKNRDPEISSQVQRIFTDAKPINEVTIKGKSYILSQNTIRETGWRLLILVDRDTINGPVYKLDQLSRRIGMAAFAFMLLFYALFFVTLMRRSRHTAERIASPLATIAERTAVIAGRPDGETIDENVTDIDELRRLTATFNIMSNQLREVYAGLEDQVAARTRELAKANEQLKATHQHLLQSEKMESIGYLAAGIAHEINTPTQFIGDNLRFIQDSLPQLFQVQQACVTMREACHQAGVELVALNEVTAAIETADMEYLVEEVPKAIAQAMEGVQRISKIVMAMKDFSHPMSTIKEMVDLNHVIETTTTVARNEWRYLANLQLDLDRTLPLVPGFAGELNQVLLNLVVNAAHAIEAKGSDPDVERDFIRIRTEQEEGAVLLSVQDSGCGIEERHRPHIFEPFFTTKEVGKGTGQGLSIAYQSIVQKHGGSIRFETEVGRGTTFFVRLPLQGAS